MIPGLQSAYERHVLGRPGVVLILLVAMLAFFAYHAKDFRLDASADSLLLEDDQDLRLFREVQARYPGTEFLVVTFDPRQDLFSDESLSQLRSLRVELAMVSVVDSAVTMLDVPLLRNADQSLIEAAQNVQRLESPTVDVARARAELLESPIYRELLLSADGQTTALLVNLKPDRRHAELLRARNDLRAKHRVTDLDEADRAALERISAEYDRVDAARSVRLHDGIEAIRTILSGYRDAAELHLGGVPMITDDMVTFVRNDLVVFGSGVALFLVIVLTLIFGEVRWVVMPLLSCLYAGLFMIGLLGLIGWKVTVISSNFLALMLIMTISMNIHLIVRYRQLCKDHPDADQRDLVSSTTSKMVRPCLYTALTTIMGFSSLVVSDIKPVIDFGWMMSVGLSVTFLTSFLLFPAILVMLPRSTGETSPRREFRLPGFLASLTERRGGAVLVLSVVVAVASAAGITRLEVENSFIDYFSEDTEIFQGLKLIDEKLGGTTPLQIVLNLEEGAGGEIPEPAADAGEQDEDLSEFEKQYAEESADSVDYWFTPYKIERIKAVHDYLEGLPQVGKVLSLASVVRVGEALNKGQAFDSLELALLYKRAPEEVRASMIDPYVSIPDNEARILLRILDSQKDLRRKDLLERIGRDLVTELGFAEKDVTVTGLLVLYNNMLQSLFRSQIATLAVVMAGIAVMFLILFRSVLLSIIGIVPNVLGAVAVLGLMGWLGIRLDMMTITIAAISIGIAVDNGIHYIYRFREELAHSGDYVETLHLCHSSIGKAVLFTTTTVIFGFSILVLSNFIPTIYFGVLTALAMLLALLASLTLLPKLILILRPFG